MNEETLRWWSVNSEVIRLLGERGHSAYGASRSAVSWSHLISEMIVAVAPSTALSSLFGDCSSELMRLQCDSARDCSTWVCNLPCGPACERARARCTGNMTLAGHDRHNAVTVCPAMIQRNGGGARMWWTDESSWLRRAHYITSLHLTTPSIHTAHRTTSDHATPQQRPHRTAPHCTAPHHTTVVGITQ